MSARDNFGAGGAHVKTTLSAALAQPANDCKIFLPWRAGSVSAPVAHVPLNAGKGIVVVYGFHTFHFNAEPFHLAVF